MADPLPNSTSRATGEPVDRRLVLLGFMCAGKTTIGAALSARLGWDFVDLDHEIERQAGRSVAELFRTEGEAAFRLREREATAALAGREGVVIAPGGGWIMQPGLLQMLGARTATVYLRVGVAEVLRRAAASPGSRPLLAGADPESAARALLTAREPLYAVADLSIDTEAHAPPEVVETLLAWLGSRVGNVGAH